MRYASFILQSGTKKHPENSVDGKNSATYRFRIDAFFARKKKRDSIRISSHDPLKLSGLQPPGFILFLSSHRLSILHLSLPEKTRAAEY